MVVSMGSASAPTSGYSLAARLLGWSIALLAVANAVLASRMPRTSKELPLRAELREWHMWVGLLLLVLVLVRLYFWFREGRPAPPAGMSRAAHAHARLMTFLTYCMLAFTGLVGIGFAWGSGYQPPLLPMLFKDDYALWKFAGYFHSAGSFTFLLINLIVVISATWFVFRYRVGWLKAYPEPLVLQCYGGLLSTLYTLVNTGSSKAPGLEVGLAVGAVVYLLSVWRRSGGKPATLAGA
jgi:cytochrome b561